MACGSGKSLWIIQAQTNISHQVSLQNSVQGIAFDPKGKRVAAARYNGVSLWWVNDPKAQPQSLNWSGSHIGLSWSPDGRFIVSSLQDNMLHAWRVADKADMRMEGYPNKVRSIVWAEKGKWLVTSGALPVVCWPFFTRDGPMGKPPMELPPPSNATVTRVAAIPNETIVAAGYQDGGVMLFRLDSEEEIIGHSPTNAPVTALAFSRDGSQLGFGRADGSAGIIFIPD
jgi:WD40 repeat protein